MKSFSLLIGTGNIHKLKEISQILKIEDIDYKTLNDFPEIKEAEENGKTFAENALIKAREYYRQTGIPCMADDSGLVVPDLGGRPGIYSSRFAGENASDMDNDLKLLHKLKEYKNPAAHYVCVVAFVDDKHEECFEGHFHGFIGREFRGKNGFGYDPIFYIKKDTEIKSVAELTDFEKNKISHRAVAVNKFKPWFKKYLEKN